MDQSEKRSRACMGSRPAAMTASSSSTSAELRCGGSCITRNTAAGDPARSPGATSTSELNCSRASCWTLLRCADAIPARLLTRSSGISIIRFAICVRSLSYCGASTRARSMPPQILQFIERARPVGAQEPGKAAIGEHPAAGLASRAVVRFVVRIAYAENLRAAPPARFSVAPMNGHAFAKRSDLLREPRARLRRQAPGPHFERAATRREEPVPFLVRQLAGQSEGRESGRVENLVRVRVPDAADDARIRQCPLQSPVLTAQRRAEAHKIGRENVYASRVHGE